MNFKGKMREKSGITLITLAVTIIILLILAGITIATITSDNGIIKNANDAKEQTEIAEEKEIVDRATIQAMGNNKRGNLVEDELQEQLDKITDSGRTEVSDNGEEFEVVFVESTRYYTVDKDGNIVEEGKIVIDKSPGDITKDENGEDIKEGQPYEIWCIEDLCAFSNMVNNVNSFNNRTVMLMQNLNFNSKYSYVNGNINVNGNILSCDSIEELQKALIENKGFYPIGDSKKGTTFLGIFEGNNKSIKNIYINRDDVAVGLFGNVFVHNGDIVYIKNLTIDGLIEGNNEVGGILGHTTITGNANNKVIIDNCINNVDINGNDNVGGIVGNRTSSEQDLIISNCYNNGNINGNKSVGGIVGNAHMNTIIINCCNFKNISGKESIGGIIGYGYNTANIAIYNSNNKGNIECEEKGGGIIGSINWGALHLENCLNTGNIKGKVIGGIGGNINSSNELLVTKNCYYMNSKVTHGFGNSNMETSEDINGISDTEMKSSEILEKLNEYVETNKEKKGIKLKKWIHSSDGYPIFE